MTSSRPGGTLLFVSMRNFMIFKENSFFPEPGFNMIVGPNGSGKSSIICAITLGLGGDPEVLKRQENLKDFVNVTSKADAVITVRLRGKPEEGSPVHEIVCTIGRETEDRRFTLDGEKICQEKLAEFVQALQIQTNNMCQFLPQDAVREFPCMTPKQVFYNTVRAVGDVETLGLSADIDTLSEEIGQLKLTAQVKTNTLEDLEQKKRQRKRLFDTLERHEELQKAIQVNEKKAKRLRIKELQRKFGPLKNEKAKLEEQVAEDEAALEGLQIRLNSDKKNVERGLEEYKLKLGAFERTAKAIKDSPVDLNLTQVESLQKELQRYLDHKSSRAMEEEGELKYLRALELKRKAACDAEEVTGDLKDLRKTLDNIQLEESRAQDTVNFSNSEKFYFVKNLEKVTANLNSLVTEDQRKLRILRSRNVDAFNGVIWLQRHKETQGFEGQVYGSVMMHIRLKNSAYATQIQRLVGFHDLEAFVCENSRDMNKLICSLRQDQKLKRISVVHSASVKIPSSPNVNMSHALKTSIQTYVHDTFECPAVIKTFLCNKFKLQNIPIFSEGTNSDEIAFHFPKYFIGNRFFCKKTGRYTHHQNIRVENCTNNAITHFISDDNFGDNEEVRNLQAEKSNLQQDIEMLDQRLQSECSTLNRIRLKINDAKNRVRTKEKQLHIISCLNSEIHLTKERLANLKMRNPKDAPNVMKSKFSQMKSKLHELSSNLEHLERLKVESMRQKSESQGAKDELQKLELKMGDLSNELKCLEKEKRKKGSQLKKVSQEYSSTLNEFKSILKELRGDGNSCEPRSLEDEMKSIKECPSNYEEVKAVLSSLHQDMASLPQLTDSEKKETKKLQEKLALAKEEATRCLNQLKISSTKLDGLEKKLKVRVQSLVSHINDRFSSLMEELGYAGAVILSPDYQTGDFGLDILVKFRQKTDLQKLSANFHSGGEKSVTAALFMLALQEMTQVPFRCVDEINQGMDAQNEKRVWQLIVQTATRYSAQYLYLAPKFPENLELNQNVAVTVINGIADNTSKDKIDLLKYVFPRE